MVYLNKGIQSLDIVINCIYDSGEAKPKISFPFFVGFLQKLYTLHI